MNFNFITFPCIYRTIDSIILIYRGELLYHPKSDKAEAIIKRVQEYLDGINALKTGSLAFGNATATNGVAKVLSQLGEAALCYKSVFLFMSVTF